MPSKCIVCSRCVRACDEQQGTFALTIQGRGFDSTVAASQDEPFMDSECVSCGACVQACPTATLSEKSLIEKGQAEHSVTTTCAYCGVGCSFRAEMQGEEVVRMVPNKDGHANHGHSCVKGRFAIGYATHPDRIVKPMIRSKISDPWREVSWEEAIGHAASELKRIQAKYGRDSIGGITSSRCTNEETYLVQKLVRAGFGNNNVDTCARVCHSPTGYGLKNTLGESAGTQNFDSVMKADVIFVIGANPTDGHPVFASQMKRRLRQGARLIVADPRRIDLVRTPHIAADYHLKLRPGTNVALINALAHVIVTEGLVKEDFVRERCEVDSFEKWRNFVVAREELAGGDGGRSPACPPREVRAAARLYATGGNGAIYYGLGVTEHSQGSTMVMGIANLAMATGNIGREGVGVNPLRGQNNVQGSCDMGSFPHEFPGYRHVSDDKVRALFEGAWGVALQKRARTAHSEHVRGGARRRVQGPVHRGRGHRAVRSQHPARDRRADVDGVHHRAGSVPERVGEVRARVPARLLVPGEGRHVHQRRAAHLARAQGDAAEARLRRLGDHAAARQCAGLPDELRASVRDHGRDRAPDADLHRRELRALDELGSIQWPCNDQPPEGTPTMHIEQVRARQGQVPGHRIRADRGEGQCQVSR